MLVDWLSAWPYCLLVQVGVLLVGWLPYLQIWVAVLLEWWLPGWPSCLLILLNVLLAYWLPG